MNFRNWFILTLGSAAFVLTVWYLPPSRTAFSGERFADPHKDIACTNCHALRADINSRGLFGSTFRQECEKCHRAEPVNNSGVPLDFHRYRDKGCPECHSFHDVEKITAAQRDFLVSFENSFQRGQCYSCHGTSVDLSHVSASHRAASELYHSDFRILGRLSPSESCLICHSERRAPVDESISALVARAPRFNEHAGHPVGVEVIPGKGEPGNRICLQIDPRIQLFGGRMECQTCHCLSSTKPHRLVNFASKKELCEACHMVS